MNQEDIIRLAQEARVSLRGHYDETGSTPQELERFAALVAAAEREACAKVCDELAGFLTCHIDRSGAEIAISLRDTIRARSYGGAFLKGK